MKIRPFHLFENRGLWCLINIEEMQAFAVDEQTAGILKKMVAGPGTLAHPGLLHMLKKRGLVEKGGGHAERTTRIEPVPVEDMALFLNQFCNLNCTYCYGIKGEYGSPGSLEESTAYRAVDWLIEQSGEMKGISLSFFGGEPFLSFPLMKAVTAYARLKTREVGKTVSFSVTTNATLLDDERLAFIKNQDMTVMVSFDGPREVQDAQRPFADGKGSYDVTVPKIRKLIEQCPRVSGHAVLSGYTDPGRVRDALLDIGFKEISMTPVSPPLFGNESGTGRPHMDLDKVLCFLEAEEDVWLENMRNRDTAFLHQAVRTSPLHSALVAFLHNKKRKYPCGAGLGYAGVSCAGDVYPCHRFVGMDVYRMGTVFEKKPDRERWLTSPLSFVEECRRCFARYHCAGGCKHDNAACRGSVFKPADDMCRLIRRETELAAYMVCRLSAEDRAFLTEEEIVPPKPCLLDF